MEYESSKISQVPEWNGGKLKNDISESEQLVVGTMDEYKEHPDSLEYTGQVKKSENKHGEKSTQGAAPAEADASGDVNMEASISADDVMRAGGFGARDDISSFLPVASDSTDFEASLRDARDYEEPQAAVCRPGLGWSQATK